MINISNLRMPLFIKNSIKIVSVSVSDTPQINGRWNNNSKPIAIPTTSARSHAIIAI